MIKETMMRNSTIVLLAAALAAPAAAAGQDAMAVANGAQVWAAQCTRCHNARPSTERTDAQWLTVMAHMRARVNLTRTQTRLVGAFLMATNLPEVAAAPATMPAPAQQGQAWSGAIPPGEMDRLVRYLRSLAAAHPR